MQPAPEDPRQIPFHELFANAPIGLGFFDAAGILAEHGGFLSADPELVAALPSLLKDPLERSRSSRTPVEHEINHPRDRRPLACTVFPAADGRAGLVVREITPRSTAAPLPDTGNTQLALLENIIEGTADPIAALNLNFRYIAVNTAYKDEFRKIFGTGIDVGASMTDALAHLPAEQLKAVQVWSRALAGERFSVIMEFGDEKRERNHYKLTYAPILDDAGKVVGASQVTANITERIKAELQLQEVARHLEKRVRESTKDLRRERELLGKIVNSIPVMLTIYDPQIKSFELNSEFKRVLGWVEEEVNARLDPMELFYPDPGIRRQASEYMRSLEPGWRDFQIAAKDGAFVDSSWANIRLSDDRRVGIGIDIRERKRTEQELRSLAQRYALLSETAGELLRTNEPQVLVESLCRRVMEHLDCHVCFNFLVDNKEGKLHLNAFAGITGEEAKRIEWLEYGSSSICGSVARDGSRYIAEHIPASDDPRLALVRSFGVLAFACHPLMDEGGRIIGTLSFGTRSRETFSDDDLFLMKAVADQVSVALVRLKNERALRESREDLNRAQRVGRIGSWRLDTRRNELLWSDENFRIFGVEPGTPMTYEGFLDIVHPEDRAYVDRKWQAALGGEPYDIEHRIVSRGEIKWVREKAELEFDEQGVLCGGFGTTQDVTERKRVAIALAASERENRELLETANSIIVRWTPDGFLRYINDYGLNFFGYARDEVIGKSVQHMIPDRDSVTGADLSRLAENIALNLGSFMFGENENIKKNGERVWVSWTNKAIKDEAGRVREILSIGNDITELKKAQQQLEAEKTKLETVVMNAPVGIVLTDPAGRNVLSNPAASVMLGREIVAEGDFPVYTQYESSYPDGRPFQLEEKPSYRSVIRGEVCANVEMVFAAPRGQKKRVVVNSTPIRDARGEINGALSVYRDVTEMKEAEEVLRRDKEMLERLVTARTKDLLEAHLELERSRRMADIGRLASTMAHELRTPLAGIKAAAFNIERKAEGPSVEKHLATINKKVTESDHIIQNLLAFTRIKSVSYEPIPVQKMLQDCITAVVEKYPKWEVQVIRNFPAADTAIEADFTQMRMLFCNLLDNAFQALPEHRGMVRVSVRLRDTVCEMRVTDSGAGIEEADLAHIFDPFFTTKSKGTGLGLTVCKEIVEMHRGTITVRSRKGRGTIFTITIPVRRPPQGPPLSLLTGRKERHRPSAES